MSTTAFQPDRGLRLLLASLGVMVLGMLLVDVSPSPLLPPPPFRVLKLAMCVSILGGLCFSRQKRTLAKLLCAMGFLSCAVYASLELRYAGAFIRYLSPCEGIVASCYYSPRIVEYGLIAAYLVLHFRKEGSLRTVVMVLYCALGLRALLEMVPQLGTPWSGWWPSNHAFVPLVTESLMSVLLFASAAAVFVRLRCGMWLLIATVLWRCGTNIFYNCARLTALGVAAPPGVYSDILWRCCVGWTVEVTGPVMLLALAFRQRDATKGACQACGYSLYKLTQTRCPECGTSFVEEAWVHS